MAEEKMESKISIKYIERKKTEMNGLCGLMIELHKQGRGGDLKQQLEDFQLLLNTTRTDLTALVTKFSDTYTKALEAQGKCSEIRSNLRLFYADLSQSGIENPKIPVLEEFYEKAVLETEKAVHSVLKGFDFVSESADINPPSLDDLPKHVSLSSQWCEKIQQVIQEYSAKIREIQTKVSELEVTMKEHIGEIEGTTGEHRFKEAREKIKGIKETLGKWIKIVVRSIGIETIEEGTQGEQQVG